jgi:cardiolipin synthase
MILSGLVGCAPLPDAKEATEKAEARSTPEIIGPRGPLSPKEAEAVLDKLSQAKSTDILARHALVMQSVGGSPLILGNKVKLLLDGPAAYEAMLKSIRSAKDHVHLETFIFEDDEVGNLFAGLLLNKRAEGVQVRILYDSAGCRNTPSAFFQRLKDGGVQALEFNPINPLKVRRKWLLNQRDHRKILIVDGRIGFTGGINISKVYSSSPGRDVSPESTKEKGDEQPWRDTHVQIEGPAVAEFQKLFLDSWQRQKGPEVSGKNLFPDVKEAGDDLVQVVASSPGPENRLTYIMHLAAFTHAENSIHIMNSYFVPDAQTVKALAEAAHRGVEVKIILPGSSDVGWAFYAGRSYYSELLQSGIKIFERQKAILHAKTVMIDGVWSTVGSTNMDLWSFMRNDEVNAVILGKDFAKEMEAMFARDLKESKEIFLEKWRQRPLIEKMNEWFRRLFFYFL